MHEMTVITPTNPNISVMGRVEPLADGSLRFGYPGVTVKFNVRAREASLQAHSSSEQSYIEFILDGGEPQIVKLSSVSKTIPLFRNSDIETHSVEIIHRSETWHGLVTLEQITLTDGVLTAPSALPQRRLLVLGDSVTCGEAIDRDPAKDCKKESSWWNPRLSYGMLTAKALDAQVNLVCFGGHGLVRTWDGKINELNLPDFVEMTIADKQSPVVWDHNQYSPDLIVSAIGTNDFSLGIPEKENYISTYVKLIQHLLEIHPKAQIVLTEGAILNGDKKTALREYLAQTVRQVNDPRVHVVPSNYYPGDACDAHPTKAQHAAMANDLTPLLRDIMNW